METGPLQLQLGHIKCQKERVSSLAGELQRAQEDNARLEPKLVAAYRKKEALERDLRRLLEVETALGFEVDHSILRSLDNPTESDILTGAEYQEKMEGLLAVMNELLVRTVANYTTAHAEQEDQERDFEQRVEDAVQARNMLTEELAKTQTSVEEIMAERIRQYELIQELEKDIAITDAELWLTRADSHRISDQLALLSTKSRGPPCRRTQDEPPQKEVAKQIVNVEEELSLEMIQEEKSSRRVENVFREVSRRQKHSKEVEKIEEDGHQLALDGLQDLLPQILEMVTRDQRGDGQSYESSRAVSSEPRSLSSSTRNRLPCDLTEIVRSALQMFDLQLE